MYRAVVLLCHGLKKRKTHFANRIPPLGQTKPSDGTMAGASASVLGANKSASEPSTRSSPPTLPYNLVGSPGAFRRPPRQFHTFAESARCEGIRTWHSTWSLVRYVSPRGNLVLVLWSVPSKSDESLLNWDTLLLINHGFMNLGSILPRLTSTSPFYAGRFIKPPTLERRRCAKLKEQPIFGAFLGESTSKTARPT